MANGKAGAPEGNQNSVKARMWTQAIKNALGKRSKLDQMKALEELAEVLLTKAQAGEAWAIKELGDRIEGKPTMVIAGDEDNPVKIDTIERVIVKAKKGK